MTMHGSSTSESDLGRSAPSPPTVLLTEQAASKRLAVEARTLQQWRVTGSGPPFVRVSRRCVRYRISDLDAWIAERIKRSTSEP